VNVVTFHSRLRFFLPVVIVLCLAFLAPMQLRAQQAAAGSTPPNPAPEQTSQTPPDPNRNLIRVDVHASQGGAPVGDLTAADFELLEDEVPQKIDNVEHVEIGGGASAGQKADPGKGGARTFVVFLDGAFTDFASSPELRRAFVGYLDRLIGPDDLVGIVTPDMSPSSMTLTRRAASLDEMLSRFWFWGHPGATTLDPIEQEYLQCYPSRSDGDRGEGGFGEEMVERRREKIVIDALTGVTKHLQNVAAGRKAVIMVTDGWLLFKPNMSMTDRNVQQTERRGNFRRQGRPPADAGEPQGSVTSDRCQHDRVSLALVDDKSALDDLTSAANRANASFYPVTIASLVRSSTRVAADSDTRDRPQDIGEFHPAAGETAARRRAESVRSLAGNTDGLAVTAASDVEPSIARIRQDLSSYYLLAYSSSNPRADGKFRKIEVRIRRPGVDVRARAGYRAPTVEEVLQARGDSHASPTAKSPVAAALADLKADRPNVPVHIAAAYAPLGGVAGGARAHVWALAEIDPAVARHGEWIGGGTIELTLTARDGETLAAKTVTIAGGERSATADLGEVTAVAGDAVVHATARAAGGRQNYAEALRLEALGSGGRPLVYRRGLETGMRYVPTAAHDFERTDRLRLDLPLTAAPASPSAELLDRDGRTIGIPVTVTTRSENGLNWVTADVGLAPLAAGTYLVRMKPDNAKPETQVVTGFRIVP
jgi:VWFA-related protein